MWLIIGCTTVLPDMIGPMGSMFMQWNAIGTA